ncbi:MAG: hypothetical protein LBE32_05735 [Burkholderiales bacterium]|nr:hypothetical protein [Burkholderiales bacterium]
MKMELSKYLARFGVSMAATLLYSSLSWTAPLQLDDRPTTGAPPPPNMLFTPSVEFPTMVEPAHKERIYNPAKEYLGYFDPKKCYTYVSESDGYFKPTDLAGADHSCSGTWSGNALNFATMAAMDTFRWALTGGSRHIDEPSSAANPGGLTVLRRSFQANVGNRQLRNRSIPTPHGNVSPDSTHQGEKMLVGSTPYNVRVRVCDVSFLEDNCVAYKDPATGQETYKPIGLIQRYQSKIRFGAFSYLLNYGGKYDQQEIDGAVLRARLKNVGPLTWNDQVNPNVEWNPRTGVFYPNPDPDDASYSYNGKKSSGVINYLNNYGFETKNYSIYDQPSEMYAEALRYLMKGSPTDINYSKAYDYSSEGFPVITDWWKNGHDSILSYCQKTAILGIGDVNTHYEQRLATGTNDMLAKANTGMANIVGEGFNAAQECWNSGANPSTCTNGGSNKIAGLAWYARNNDLRPDLTAGVGGRKVTVDTYWVDVLEQGAHGRIGGRVDDEYVHKNQYWLAAKYGGSSPWNSKGRTYRSNSGTVHQIPDNYFPAGDPEAMVNGLTEIFAEVGVETPGTGAGAGWVSDADGNATDYYLTRYSAVDWSGAFEAYKFNGIKPDGSVDGTLLWDAATKIDGQNWDTGRRIVTYAKQADGTYKGVPFRLGSSSLLTEVQKNALGGDDPTRQAALNYLRGDKTNEGLSGYRERKTLLGDIVHSKPVEVGAPSASYSENKNPGYSKFKADRAGRAKVVYVGANDGMLHAINGIGEATEGMELWAYIPSFLFEGPDNPKAPEVSGLQALTRSTYSHRYYVDAAPMVQDVDFHHTKNPGGGLPEANEASADWRTVLVSGLGKGGKGFFALDVTDPSVTSETDAASRVLWEFPRLEETDPGLLADISDMGFSFGRPLITKTKAWGWVVVLTSGYNNDSGKGVLYILNIKTGETLAKVETGAGTMVSEAGFAQVSGYTQSYEDYTTDQIYGGDLLGNLWRFDLTGTGASIPAPDKIAEFKTGDGKVQPVTAAPIIEVIEDTRSAEHETRWIAVGTGQWLSHRDIDTSLGNTVQTMYVIRDGKHDATEIASGTTLNRSDLTQLSSPSAGLAAAPEKGWYYDMDGVIGSSRERVVFPAVFVPNTLVWAGVIPQAVRDECRIEIPDGKSRFYVVDLATGKTKLTSGSAGGSYFEKDALTMGMDIVQSGDEFYVVATSSKGESFAAPPEAVGGRASGDPSRSGVINWRTVE